MIGARARGSSAIALSLLLGMAPITARAVDESASPRTAVPPAEAAGRMTVPEGFKVTLFAAEPDVRQPIAFTTDERGRLWVAECYSYPGWSPEAKDRIIILEDTDGDGRFDRRTLFHDKIANISGIEVGFGGVWVCAIPNILFIPDKNGDDVPDGPPAVVLDGWSTKARHNVVNGLKWGPDGWLYGCHGILDTSRVGKPGTPDAQRVALNCSVWRYHPTTAVFETVASGTTNPWGIDFDDYGEIFITNCVIPHLFHVIPGAHFQRMYGLDLNPNVYGLMESCADHIHWAGGAWQESREGKGRHSDAGGGHAHAGAMIYLGDNWPDRYRGGLFTSNLHGHRINHDSFAAKGSGYVARHEKDFLFANDPWFRGLELKYGPDGSVFMTDWSDTGECHEDDADGAHRENGRIYKISYGTPKPTLVNLAKLSDDELVGLQLHKNEWYVRQARRLLHERAAAGRDLSRASAALARLLETQAEAPRKLRALWALYVIGGLSEARLIALLDNPNEYVRGWAVRLLVDRRAASPAALNRLAALAKSEPKPTVRLQLASALQKVPLGARWPIAEPLASHGDDSTDANLPLMIWYGVEPAVAANPLRAVELAAHAAIPVVRHHVARRIVAAAGGGTESPAVAALIARIGSATDPARQRDLLEGAYQSLRGQKQVPAPQGWSETFGTLVKSADAQVRRDAFALALLFGDSRAADTLRTLVNDRAADLGARRSALEVLVETHVPGLAPLLQALLDDRDLRGQAIRGLAAYQDEATPKQLIARYRSFDESEREDAIGTLAARPATARALLDAIAAGTIGRRDLSIFLARQIVAFGDAKLTARLEQVWGALRPTAQAKAELLVKYKATLSPGDLKAANPANGRSVFQRTCAQCHKLYGVGGDVGPELTGSDRANVDYVLENVLSPSAAVANDYMLTTVATRDGRVLLGLLREQTERTLTVQTVNERVVLDRADVEEIKSSYTSLMPEGLLDKLSPDEVRDLIAYLGSKQQVPLPAAK